MTGIGALFLIVSGLIGGSWLEARKWRRNADEVYRVESGGRLYKVEYADTKEWQVKDL